MTTWQEAARGIPVWPQALTRRISGLADVLALDNADTQAMYLPRLAIALGCPEEAAGEGVVAVTYKDDGVVSLFAGPAMSEHGVLFEWAESVPVEPYAGDRLLALARAWPEDKRVTP